MLCSHPVKISVGSQIQIRVRSPQTGRQSGKNLTLSSQLILRILSAFPSKKFHFYVEECSVRSFPPGLPSLLRSQRLWFDHRSERLAQAEGDKFQTLIWNLTWLKQRVLEWLFKHFQLFIFPFPAAPSPSAPWCSFSDRGDLGRTSRTSSISGWHILNNFFLLSCTFCNLIQLMTPLKAYQRSMGIIKHTHSNTFQEMSWHLAITWCQMIWKDNLKELQHTKIVRTANSLPLGPTNLGAFTVAAKNIFPANVLAVNNVRVA